eukprot:gene6091-6559_t
MKFIASIIFLGCFVLPISAWMNQRLPVRSFSKTRHYGLLPRKQLKKELIVPGITIPIDGVSEAIQIVTNNDIPTELSIGKFVVSAGGTVAGKQKSDVTALNDLQSKYLSAVVKNRANLPATYQYFGNANNEEILKQLLRHNPFFTSALQGDGSNFAITSFVKSGQSTRYSKLLTAYEATFPRVNVKFNNNLDVTGYNIYDGSGNDITSKYKKDEAIKYLLFTLSYYAEVVHAGIHIYNLINVIGILHSSEDSKNLIYPWAETYLLNVPLKYFEVEKLLLNEGGALVGGGFLGNRDQVLQYTTDLLKAWLGYSTFDEFVEGFIFPYIPKGQRNGFLPEYFTQANLIPGFTNDLTNAIKTADSKAYTKLNTKLTKYYQDLGNKVSTYKDVSTWIQIQSALGIFHGGTLSFSRYIATPSFLPLLDPTNTGAYTKQDEKIAITVLATTDGLTPDRYVYSSNLLKSQSVISSVLKTYNDQSNALKSKYFDSIKGNAGFAEYGWIWTDFAPDLIDNKQLTLTTYV